MHAIMILQYISRPIVRFDILKYTEHNMVSGVRFWPGMCKKIETMVEKCLTCQEYRSAHQKEPFRPHDSYQCVHGKWLPQICSSGMIPTVMFLFFILLNLYVCTK